MPTADFGNAGGATGTRGCLVTAVSAVVLALISPFVFVVRGWRSWRRGSDIRTTIEIAPLTDTMDFDVRRVDLRLDVPPAAEPGFRQRLTEAVVKVAESLRSPDDVYHLAYRLPWEKEPVVMPVGPQLQELGERFSLVQSQGVLAGRTTVWLTLPRGRALSEVVDPDTYDPEADGEPESLLAHADARWSMATEWARVGSSLIVRMIIVVPARHTHRVTELLASLD